MPSAAIPNNKQTTAIGLSIRKVIVEQVVPTRGIVIVSDQKNFLASVPYRSQPGGGRIPRENDIWLIDRSTGGWNLARYLSKDDDDLGTHPGPVTIEGNLFVTGDTSAFNLHVGGTFVAEGSSTFSSDLTVDGPLTANDGLTVTGATTLNTGLTVTGQTLLHNTLVTEDDVYVYDIIKIDGKTPTDGAIEAKGNGDAFPRYTVRRDGQLGWGPGTLAPECFIYRDSFFRLKTNAVWEAANFDSGVWYTHYPAWTTSTGNNLPNFGGATVNFRYMRAGRMITCQFEFIFAFSTSFGGGGGADNWRFSIPTPAASAWPAVGWANVQASTGRRLMCLIAMYDTTHFGLDISSRTVDDSAITTGQVDAQAPWNWVATPDHIIRGTFTYEALNPS